LTGPRQSGKTTLCRSALEDFDYVSLESLDNRQEAITDPRGFLDKFPRGAILDEIQRTPDLPSYIQEYVDQDKQGQRKFVLTGSQQLEVSHSVNQSLAGRTAVLRLLPFAYAEIFGDSDELPPVSDLLFTGFYPRIHAQQLSPVDALSAYVSTYIERDVRSLSNIRNMDAFERFLRLCAANIGQLLDYTRFANDVGVDQETIKAWLSLLKASYICFTLPPHSGNYRKRLVKSPKLYFYDVGLASYLLGIRKQEQIQAHPLRGALFENYVITDVLKTLWNRGDDRPLFFFRDSSGHEIDLLMEDGADIHLLEIKAGRTLTKEQFKGLEWYRELRPEVTRSAQLVYGGEHLETRYGCPVLHRGAIAKGVNLNVA
ncbi:ATP-binding protein, partial [bacterium]|nr:ATP-binding protein [bacterium]